MARCVPSQILKFVVFLNLSWRKQMGSEVVIVVAVVVVIFVRMLLACYGIV